MKDPVFQGFYVDISGVMHVHPFADATQENICSWLADRYRERRPAAVYLVHQTAETLSLVEAGRVFRQGVRWAWDFSMEGVPRA